MAEVPFRASVPRLKMAYKIKNRTLCTRRKESAPEKFLLRTLDRMVRHLPSFET